MRMSALAAVAAMSLLVGGTALPARSATSVEDLFGHSTSCLGLLFTDPAAHASSCGIAPAGDNVESLTPEGGGEPTEVPAPDCYGYNLETLQPGERILVAARCPT